LQSNTVVVRGAGGVLLIDPGLSGDEMSAIADGLRELGQPVVAGFSTHPHWDHVLWHTSFGAAPRYGTARCAATLHEVLSNPNWREQEAEGLPPELAGQVPLDQFGLITGLPSGTTQIPWDGPRVRIIEHQAHALGHAALLIEQRGVLVAGDMLSDILIPFLDLGAADPIEDYLEALRLLEGVASEVHALVPGHGSIGGHDQVRARIDQDFAYVQALRDGRDADDERLSAAFGKDWLPGVDEWQRQQLAQRREGVGTPGQRAGAAG
jgi:glyoxylase-like metal-dependent hydrolase (beta-lactamase superfamily II)